MTAMRVCILQDTDVKLWGLGGRERLVRMLNKAGNVEYLDDLAKLPQNVPVLLLRGNNLFDPRLLKSLLQLDVNTKVYASSGEQIAAVCCKSGQAQQVAAELIEGREKKYLNQFSGRHAESLAGAYDPRLLKYDPVTILAINEASRNRLEKELFDGSYKGVTDFITKWLWPVPARVAVRWCVRYGITPNQVTVFSLLLAVLTGLAFWNGSLWLGLLLGWIMTFLDTVDGKLARVTVTSSRFGDILDHGIDLVHPPLWYLAWGWGIAGTSVSSTEVLTIFWLILVAYIGGRLCEGAFDLWIADFRLFLWRPFDSYNRLITARRNPNLLILTVSLFCHRPDIGLYAVLGWHVISTLVLFARLCLAGREKSRQGELSTWLARIDPDQDSNKLEVKLFTRLAKFPATN